MNTVLCSLLLAGVALNLASGAESEKITYYVQLIRGNNAEIPPVPEAKLIGPKLAKKLRPVFRWKNYWELNRQAVNVAPGQKLKTRLSQEREVEIDLTRPGKRMVTAYAGGKALSRFARPVGEGMTIIGGDRDRESVWFLIVRRDKPAN